METIAHILVVDDDTDIRNLLAEALETYGFKASTATDGPSMQKVLATAKIDLVVLDLTLPGDDGLTLCRNLRSKSNLPVIMLTARGDPVDRILGLEMGADDYLTKPFEPRELLARIRTVLRRTWMLPPNLEKAEVKSLSFAGWTLDLRARHLVSPTGLTVLLSAGEFRMLKALLEHSHRVLSRDQLLNMTQGRDADPFDRSVDLQISRLRQKLGEAAKGSMLLRTIRNEGYTLAADVTVST